MVCDGALVVNLVASAMMNGVCCIHSMQEEEKRHEEQRRALRKAMNVEWQRQRLMELEDHEKKLRLEGKDAATIAVEERRRLLMTSKMAAASSSQSSRQSSKASSKLPPREERKHKLREMQSVAQTKQLYRQLSMERSRSAPVSISNGSSQQEIRVPVLVGGRATREALYSKNVSSLLDEDDDDDDHDNDEFEEIRLT